MTKKPARGKRTPVKPVDPDRPLTEAEKEKAKAKEARKYFHSGTQRAIVEYQKSVDKKERERLYVKEIMPAFDRLAENLINIHRFGGLHDSSEDLKNDCVNFLFETIGKFDDTRGTNAFSYFNVVARNWLIIKTKHRLQRARKSVSLDDPDGISSVERRLLEDQQMVPGTDVVIEGFVDSSRTMNILRRIKESVKTENELSCINSIITVFENSESIELINKTSMFLYVRELSGLTAKQMSLAMSVIKRAYRETKDEVAIEEERFLIDDLPGNEEGDEKVEPGEEVVS